MKPESLKPVPVIYVYDTLSALGVEIGTFLLLKYAFAIVLYYAIFCKFFLYLPYNKRQINLS